MLLTVLIYVAVAFLQILNSILSLFVFPLTFLDTIKEIFVYIFRLNGIFPVFQLLSALLVILSFEMIILLARLISGALSIIRGGGKMDI